MKKIILAVCLVLTTMGGVSVVAFTAASASATISKPAPVISHSWCDDCHGV